MATADTIEKAVAEGNWSEVEQCVKAEGANVAVGALSRTILHLACKYGRSDWIGQLVGLGANPNAKDVDGATPLMAAALNGSSESIQELSKAGADLNLTQRGGKTALHFAAMKKNEECIKALLDCGAVKNVVDGDGKTWDGYYRQTAGSANAQAFLDSFAKFAAELGANGARESAVGKMNENLDRRAQAMATGDLNKAAQPNRGAAGSEPRGSSQAQSQEAQTKDPKKMTKEQILAELAELGFDNLTTMSETDPYSGRDDEVGKIMSMLDKKQNVMVLGQPGSGKTSVAMILAGELGKKGKIMLQLPSKLFRGNQYRGSINEAMQKWIPLVLELYPDVTLFIDEAHNLSTGKTGSDQSETPMQILKEYLDDTGDKRIQIVGATTPKEFVMLSEDEGFSRRFTEVKLEPMSHESIVAILKDPNTIERFKKWGYEIEDEDSWARVVDVSCDLLDEHIFNQAFPKKAFDFIKHLLKDQSARSVSAESIEQSFASFYNVPIEVIRGEVAEDSVYMNLFKNLTERIQGQDSIAAKLEAALLSDIMLNNGGHKKPNSFMMMGPTGVGKSETCSLLSDMLKLPMISYPMSEFKTLQDTQRLLEKISEFASNNYSGIIVFDELEKANPQVLDILLNLMDKGSIGSGADQVKCGNLIVIATSNIGANESVLLKKALAKEFGPEQTNIDEDWLREKLVDFGMRPEMVNRFGKILDFNYIDVDAAIKIADKLFAKRCEEMLSEKGIEVKFSKGWVENYVRENYDENSGARSCHRIVTEAFNKIISDKSTLLLMKRGSVIEISGNNSETVIDSVSAAGVKSSSVIKDSSVNDRQRLEQVFDTMRRKAQDYQASVDKLATHHGPGEGDSAGPQAKQRSKP